MSSQPLHWHGYFISNGFCYCVTAIPWAWFSSVTKLALITSPVAALYSLTTPVGTPTVAAWVKWRFARAFPGMAQSPATTIRIAYKARKGCLQFDVVARFILGSKGT
jgi:hypothetical protein